MPLLYHTVAYSHLGQSLALAAGLETGTIENREFPDGEHYRRVITPPGGKDVVLVGGTIDDTSTLEIYDLGAAWCQVTHIRCALFRVLHHGACRSARRGRYRQKPRQTSFVNPHGRSWQ